MSFLVHLHVVGGDSATPSCLSNAENRPAGDCLEAVPQEQLFRLRTPSEIPARAQAAQAVHYKPATRAGMAERELTKPNVYRSSEK